jgi:hypothetical protein
VTFASALVGGDVDGLYYEVLRELLSVVLRLQEEETEKDDEDEMQMKGFTHFY